MAHVALKPCQQAWEQQQQPVQGSKVNAGRESGRGMCGSPKLLPVGCRGNIIHAEHAEDCQLQQHMLLGLLGRALLQDSLQGPFPAQKVTQICLGGRQNLLAVIEVDLGEEDTCMGQIRLYLQRVNQGIV